MMRRRLLACATAWPFAPGLAQERGKRLGFLLAMPTESQSMAMLREIESALRAQGLIEQQDLQFVIRHAGNSEARLDQGAADLVRAGVHAIIAVWTPAAHAARRATSTVPIVFWGAADPVATGLARSLAQPGGNVTGVTAMGPDLANKSLQLLRECLPRLRRIGLLTNGTDPFTPTLTRHLEQAAASMALEALASAVRPGQKLESLFDRWAGHDVEAVFVQPTLAAAAPIALARRHRMATFSFVSAFARSGGLLAYSTDVTESATRVAAIVRRVLDGANPAQLPIEQPTRFRLVVNAAAARAIGVEIPRAVMLRADEVIE